MPKTTKEIEFLAGKDVQKWNDLLWYSKDEVDELLRQEHGGKLLAQTDLAICKNKLNQLEYSRRIPILQAEHFRVLEKLKSELIDSQLFCTEYPNKKICVECRKEVAIFYSKTGVGYVCRECFINLVFSKFGVDK